MNSTAESPSPLVRLVRTIPAEVPGWPRLPDRWVIRPSGHGDQQRWLAIQNELLAERELPRRWSEVAWERELTSRPWWSPERLLMAHASDDATPSGCVAIELNPAAGWAQLHWLAVRPKARRRGIATRLLEEAERQARRAGCEQLRAETLRAWTGAVRFYLARGFTLMDVPAT
jgi:GNAT superfamily N-acetyltransferase